MSEFLGGSYLTPLLHLSFIVPDSPKEERTEKSTFLFISFPVSCPHFTSFSEINEP